MSQDAAFGANLLGAILGGFLEAVSFISGMRFVLLFAAGLYLLSAAGLPRLCQVSCPLDTPSPFN